MSPDSPGLIPAPPPLPERPQPPPAGSALASPRWLLAAEPVPRAPPELPPDLPEMPPVARWYTCMHWFARSTEQTLSPGGHLRALVRLVIRLVIVAGILSLGAAAVLACVAAVLGVVVVITGQVVAILVNILYALLLAMAILALCIIVLFVGRVLLRTG